MKQILAILILLMGLQPLPAQPCDMDAAPAAVDAGQAGMTHAGMDHAGMNMDPASEPGPAMDCCTTHGSDDPAACSQAMDCVQCPSTTLALAMRLPTLANHADVFAPEPVSTHVPRLTFAAPYRPPTS